MTAVLGGPPQVDGGHLRTVLRAHAAGVVVVTARDDDGRPVGFTASSFVPVSLDPPLVGVLVGERASSLPALRVGCWAAVHVLGADQADLARQFAGPAADRFAGVPTGPVGVPLLPRANAHVVGHVVQAVPAGDHRLVLLAVTGAWRDPRAGSGPLLHVDGGFAAAPVPG